MNCTTLNRMFHACKHFICYKWNVLNFDENIWNKLNNSYIYQKFVFIFEQIMIDMIQVGLLRNCSQYYYVFVQFSKRQKNIKQNVRFVLLYIPPVHIHNIYTWPDRTTNLFNQHRLRAAMITFGPRARWVVEWSILYTDKCLKVVWRGRGGCGTINII